ncbi:MAG: hypothetical protein HW421_1766 [Ignavibacteria bacterium]|nr:hypothetical protein [Ignavibacteria bacterium]
MVKIGAILKKCKAQNFLSKIILRNKQVNNASNKFMTF